MKGKCEIDASYDTSFETIYQIHKFDAILDGIKDGLLFVTPLIEDKDEQEFANEEVADGIDILDFKPYLRPMSSMTEEEKEELRLTYSFLYSNYPFDNEEEDGEEEEDSIEGHYEPSVETFDWYDKKMFDYHGLIDKGLAIAVTEENNPYVVFKK